MTITSLVKICLERYEKKKSATALALDSNFTIQPIKFYNYITSIGDFLSKGKDSVMRNGWKPCNSSVENLELLWMLNWLSLVS